MSEPRPAKMQRSDQRIRLVMAMKIQRLAARG
ncbi:MAG: hypothetical protein JWQ35_442 [Bacteriovoracaceae bacterium]|nr:hypothetical protein [Bacteriovoracaceae bacterium]